MKVCEEVTVVQFNDGSSCNEAVSKRGPIRFHRRYGSVDALHVIWYGGRPSFYLSTSYTTTKWLPYFFFHFSGSFQFPSTGGLDTHFSLPYSCRITLSLSIYLSISLSIHSQLCPLHYTAPLHVDSLIPPPCTILYILIEVLKRSNGLIG